MSSGALGILIIWVIYMIYAILTRNAFANLDQFAGLIFGSLGFGWLLFAVILLFGLLFGALGGAIGSGISMLVKLRPTVDLEDNLENKKFIDIKNIDK
ncbi:MAG: hypothetical protein EU532_02190 [Promethearchaeota archaeon]|nr:MAG: hypothetical protein EU532_02190 [Candidatus Lokiarchaeota archaeon]